MTRPKPLVLVTNDDGIRCGFLTELVAALSGSFRVAVAAPAGERSWIGRAFSREAEVTATPAAVPGAETAWAIVGTPSDCVNIALNHLLDEPPDAVVSGINIGFNITMPLILSSGTVAGAIEGAAHGIRAAAFSLDLEHTDFERLRLNGGAADGAALVALRCAAARATALTATLLGQPAPERVVVHNYNFPARCTAATPVVRTGPADVRAGALFAPSGANAYRFRWSDGRVLPTSGDTDRDALHRGEISHTLLDFSRLGRLSDAEASR